MLTLLEQGCLVEFLMGKPHHTWVGAWVVLGVVHGLHESIGLKNASYQSCIVIDSDNK